MGQRKLQRRVGELGAVCSAFTRNLKKMEVLPPTKYCARSLGYRKSAFAQVVLAACATDGVMMQTVAHAAMNVTRTRRPFMSGLLPRLRIGCLSAVAGEWGTDVLVDLVPLA